MSTKQITAPPESKHDLIFGLPAPQLEHIPDTVRPACELCMKIHSDALQLWSHRARAWLAWPEMVSTCKTFDELARAQGDYVAQMRRDYAHFTDGVLQHMMIEQDTFEDQDEAAPQKPVASEQAALEKVAA